VTATNPPSGGSAPTVGAQRPAVHRRISTRIYAGFFAAVALTIVASVVSWLSFSSVNENQSQVTEERVPELVNAFSLAELSYAIAAAAPRITTAPSGQFTTISAEVTAVQQQFKELFQPLATADPDNIQIQGISAAAEELENNIITVTADMPRLYNLNHRIELLKNEISALSNQTNSIVLPALDNQLFFQITGYRNFATEPTDAATRTSAGELLLYRHLNTLQADIAQTSELMGSALIASEAGFVEPLRENFESTEDRIQISLSTIAESRMLPGLESVVMSLLARGSGNQGVFQVAIDRLDIIERQDRLLAENQSLAAGLLSEVNAIVQNAQAEADQAARNSAQTIDNARVILAVISAIGIIGAGLISWLLIGRVLLRRIAGLSGRMRALARGDLEEEVEVSGRDEIAEMASALEVFRRHALEVQRLNLVEELAQELGQRNNELQGVLAELGQAQDQIVAREKLAALGEVTAGVAHEIRNPLNFINNFSAASAELLEELAEVYEEIEADLSDDQQALVAEINQDLIDNLERIQSHGKRANRIVQDMLMMGRGGGDTQMTDLNDLIHEHSLLAYHSARAQDPEFQVLLEEEFDPDMGQVEVVPQDLGRVFLNFVANAGYATNKKQKELIEAGTAGDYTPTIVLKSQRTDDHAILSVRDNGNGIPPHVAAKMFDPFFTTKPTNEGTGLGLALSNDIIREHGGTITVDTEPGEFTEMVVELPLIRAKAAPGDENGGGGA